jgi:hypothetical protein
VNLSASKGLNTPTIILPVVLCGYETWCLILRDESSLNVFQKRILRKICGRWEEEIDVGRKRLGLCVEALRWAGNVARTE